MLLLEPNIALAGGGNTVWAAETRVYMSPRDGSKYSGHVHLIRNNDDGDTQDLFLLKSQPTNFGSLQRQVAEHHEVQSVDYVVVENLSRKNVARMNAGRRMITMSWHRRIKDKNLKKIASYA